jgi:predicted cupin superfamily sugar epimerase
LAGARDVIERLTLAPHPEGGWYRETWRDAPAGGGRGAGTAIHFLLEAGQRSHWHRIDAAELWLWQAGAPLRLETATDGGETAHHRLGPDILGGDRLQACVAAGQWQAAESLGEWSLVACVVAPAFDFAGFELAPAGWRPGG